MGRKKFEDGLTRDKRYRLRNPEKFKAGIRRQKLKKLGLTVAQYDALFVSQGGVCAICSRQEGKKRLAVDHNHKTGVIRGLLCSSCNRGLGHFHDRVNWLAKAIVYIS